MKNVKRVMISLLMVVVLLVGSTAAIYAAPVTDEEVQAVIEQLEAIDTLAEMQAARKQYAVASKYNASTTDTAIITKHENARVEYETYVSKMFAARLAAQQAYDALTDEQKAQIDEELVAKLDNELDTVFKSGTFAVTPRYDEYSFLAVDGFRGMAYEISNHGTFGPSTPATFILVDTSNGEETWTPDGKYVNGESNYEVLYCIDCNTGIVKGTYYKRVNLENSSYFSDACAKQVRAIVENSYPYVTIDEMKANLKAGGLDAEFVDQLTRSDIIAGVQMAIWTYANAEDSNVADHTRYYTTFDMTANSSNWDNPMHDYTNELWDWWTTKQYGTSYDARAEYRVNTLTYYLATMDPEEADADQTVVSDVEVVRAELTPVGDDLYKVGMYVLLDGNVGASDDVKIHVTSYSENEDGTVNITSQNSYQADSNTKYSISVKAKMGDTIKVEVEGIQYVSEGVYLYEPEGDRGTSQTLVGASRGKTIVGDVEEFVLEEDIDQGLRIYKTETDTGLPLSDITFHIYQVNPDEGEELGEVPSEEAIAKYQTEANLVGSVVTDNTGYAAMALEKGIYMVVEEHNETKVKAPVDPFWIYIPMPVSKEDVGEGTDSDTEIEIEYLDVVSVYPKNEPPHNPPPPIPPPGTLNGKFTIVKHDADNQDMVLAGAKFQVYRVADEDDENSRIIRCDGVDYAVVPVVVDDEELFLVTGEDGTAVSPALDCEMYFLVEVEAPIGYMLKGDIATVTVLPNEVVAVNTVYIANQKQSLLPETGGIGTVAFYIVGLGLVLGAGVILVSRRRMNFCE